MSRPFSFSLVLQHLASTSSPPPYLRATLLLSRRPAYRSHTTSSASSSNPSSHLHFFLFYRRLIFSHAFFELSLPTYLPSTTRAALRFSLHPSLHITRCWLTRSSPPSHFCCLPRPVASMMFISSAAVRTPLQRGESLANFFCTPLMQLLGLSSPCHIDAVWLSCRRIFFYKANFNE